MSGLPQFVYRAQKRLWKLLRPHTRGVKVMLFNGAGEVLLIRNTYGRTDLFVLPGGGVRPWESAEAAARREVREELGCTVQSLMPVATFSSTMEGKRDTVQLFKAEAVGEPAVDNHEVAEAAFFPLDSLPAKVSPATRRRVEEHLGMRAAEREW